MAIVRRLARAARIVAVDARIPKPLRALLGVSLLPIPGPVDEALLVLVAIPLLLFYRRPFTDAWRAAAPDRRG
ncbi:MAG TPA: hypothetical protein VFA82_02435 [Gaiellaceae bacterium]|nr:hypothetical protein [Gaiellaceae bacterium]